MIGTCEGDSRSWASPSSPWAFLLGVLWIGTSMLYLARGDVDALDAVIAGAGTLAALTLMVRGWRRLREPRVGPAER